MSTDRTTQTTEQETTRGLESDVDELINGYRAKGSSAYQITYQSPSLARPTKLGRTLDKARSTEETLKQVVDSFKAVDRRIMFSYGLEDLPVLVRPMEIARRFARSFASKGASDTDTVVEIGNSYIEGLEQMHGLLVSSLSDYTRAGKELGQYLLSLEDGLISLAEQGEDVNRKLLTLTAARERYELEAPQDGKLSEKIVWQRGAHAMKRDARDLRGLKLMVSRNLNHTFEVRNNTLEAEEALAVSRQMNQLAADSARILVDQLRINIDMYGTSTTSTDIALRLGGRLERASRFSELLSQGTYSRMSALGSVIEDFSLPNGSKGSAISRGGILEGLRGYLTDMQEMQDSLVADHEQDLLP